MISSSQPSSNQRQMSPKEGLISVAHHITLQKHNTTENRHLQSLDTKEIRKEGKDDQQIHTSANVAMLKHDKEHDVNRHRPGKASDITNSQNALVQNDNENKLQMLSVAQLKVPMPSDVKSQRPGKASDITKSQNVLAQNE
eukprot:6050269-Ditylum_brightwellii.AAC.1